MSGPLFGDRSIAIRRSYYMRFEGVMSTCKEGDPISGQFCQNPQGWYTPWKGWRDLWEKLNANGVGQSRITFATNIKYQP
jgi:hypothetical protein